MISSCRQQWTAVQALQAGGLDPSDAWVSYVGFGGEADEVDVSGYLSGLIGLPRADRDLLSYAINEMLAEKGLVITGAQYSQDGATGKTWVADGLYRLLVASNEVSTGHPSRPRSGRPAEGDAGRPEDRAGFLAHEARRCDALSRSGLLDSGAEERFDRITAKARRRFGTSSASIALITDDRQVIKSVVGPIGQDLPRDVALCSRTVEADRTLVITDARSDPDYSDHPLVAGSPGIRFYAGHPLTSADGWRIGSLCVIDDRPRAFTPADARDLRLLAAQVQLEMWTGEPPG